MLACRLASSAFASASMRPTSATVLAIAGRVIVATTSRERAELKQEQVHAFGKDWRIPR